MRSVACAFALMLTAPHVACAAGPRPAPEAASSDAARAVDLPATVTLAPGERVIARGPDLAVRFADVSEDSRCPEGVNCIWAGRAVVQVEVGDGEAPTVALEVGGEPRDLRGLSLAAEALDPHPKADSPIRPEDYRLRLRIELASD